MTEHSTLLENKRKPAPGINANSFIFVIGFGVLSYFGDKIYGKVESAHDDIAGMKAQISLMIPRQEYDLKIAEIQARIATLDIEIARIKQGTK